MLIATLPLGLFACGGSSNSTQAKTPPPAVGGGPTSGSAGGLEAATPVLNSVTAQVPGLTQSQAAVGAGSVLGLAQARMPEKEFSKIKAGLPGTDALIATAKQAGLPGKDDLKAGGMSSLTGVFDTENISQTQASQIASALGNQIGQTSGHDAQQAFMKAVHVKPPAK